MDIERNVNGNRAEGRPITWLAFAIANLFGLMMLYIPYQFQSPPFRPVYEHLRPLGILFTLSALGITASSFNLGLPQWLGKVSKLVLVAGLTELTIVVALPHGMWTRALTYSVLAIAVLLSIAKPAWEERLLPTLLAPVALFNGLVIAFWPHLLSSAIPMTPSIALAVLFLFTSLLQITVHCAGNRWSRLVPVFILASGVPFVWFSFKWIAVANWTGAGLYGLIGLVTAVYGLYLLRPWRLQIPKLRQRVIALTVLLTVIPLFTIGAISVYAVQQLEKERTLSSLKAAVLQLEQHMDLLTDGQPDSRLASLPALASYPNAVVRVLEAAETPPDWLDAQNAALEYAELDGSRKMLAFARLPDLGKTLEVSLEMEDAFSQALRLSVLILLTTLAVLAGAVTASLMLSRRVTQHLSEVRSAARSLGELQFHARLSAPQDDDEVADLAFAFNRMAGTLETYTEEIQAQNEELQVQSEELQSQQEELLAQNEELLAQRDELEAQSEMLQEAQKALRLSEGLLADQREVLEQIATGAPLHLTLDTLVRFLEDWVGYGRCGLFLVDESGVELRFTAGPNLPDTFRTSLQKFPAEPGPEARRLVFTANAPVFSPSVSEDPLWQETAPIAIDCGLTCCWSMPILDTEGEPLGVVTLFTGESHAPSEQDARLAQITCRIAAIAIGRQRTEEGQVQKLHSVIRHMSEGVLAITADETLLFANQAAIRLLNLPEHPETLTLEEANTPALLAAMLKRVNAPGNYAPERSTFSVENVKIEAHVSPVYTDLSRYGAVAVLRNVTEEEQFRRLQENFVANVSHELRGPLASVSATLEAFADGVIPEHSRTRYLNAMLTEMNRLRRLSYDVVDLTRLDSGLVKLNNTRFSLDQLFRNLETKTVQRCTGAGLVLKVNMSGLAVFADYDRVEQVLMNLLDNAIRFTPEGGTIHLFARGESEFVRTLVSDTGIGIPPENLPHIWERFYKVDQARTLTPGSGTGLGLSIVRQLVEQMGGETGVISKPGEGTTVSFTLPAG